MIISLLLLVAVFFLTAVFFLFKWRKAEGALKKLQQDIELMSMPLGSQEDQSSGEMVSDARDTLTGLPYRAVLEDRMRQLTVLAAREGRQFALLMIDVDDFNMYTKMYPGSSDFIIRELACRLQMSIRQIDTLARFGGATFFILLPILSKPETAIYVAQRIQDNVLEKFMFGDDALQISVSVGIAVYPIDGQQVESLLKSANEALVLARQAGKGQYRFRQASLHDLGSRELSLSQLIRSDEFIQQMQLQYKLFFDVDKNVPFYAQTTLHLLHPQHGIVSFGDIVTLVENSGRIAEVYSWLFSTMLVQVADWQQHNFHPDYVAIPVHLRQLETSSFVHDLVYFARQISTHGISLIVEISDDKIVQNPGFIETIFGMLHEAKIHVCVGIFALSHFAEQKFGRIPLSYLRIDKKLVKDAVTKEVKAVILSRIIELANGENIIVIVEGVDTEVEKQMLLKLGCHMMEGKLFGALTATGLPIPESRPK